MEVAVVILVADGMAVAPPVGTDPNLFAPTPDAKLFVQFAISVKSSVYVRDGCDAMGTGVCANAVFSKSKNANA